LELDVFAVLGESGLTPNRLEIEITESVLLEDTEASIATFERIHAFGVKIAMHDFGTGYSSLSYLQKFPFDKIKIDKSFISGASMNANSAAIVRAILGLAASLRMTTTVEGVETEDQFRNLSASGCTEM
jgi:EAL domain-containing protein (putative c-di-GMP-specific phosphodiesterase class I)